ncbi:hypothetical protein L3X38_011175 [Prunus dulcis]|uniref:Uncharacterized protein n=1 Tax=Prunus dulcis TaxID=3755 RepID=A0AAD4ZEW7_PRUDU|nr:hypothetical protein L3X38_011175 [Prunus dulcis]
MAATKEMRESSPRANGSSTTSAADPKSKHVNVVNMEGAEEQTFEEAVAEEDEAEEDAANEVVTDITNQWSY